MEHSPRVIRNLRGRYRLHNSPQLLPILSHINPVRAFSPIVPTMSQINPVHIFLSCSFQDTFQYYPPTYASVFQIFSFLQIPQPKVRIHFCPPHVQRALPISPSQLDHHSNICWAIQSMKFLVMLFSPFSSYLLFLRSQYLPPYSTLAQPQDVFPSVRKTKFHTHTKQ